MQMSGAGAGLTARIGARLAGRAGACLVAVALLALAALPAPAGAALPAGFIGISPQSFNREDMRLMREAGIASVRLPLHWHEVQGRHPAFAEPDWSGFDRGVRMAAEEGMEVFAVVYGTPRWVSGSVADLPVADPAQRRAWARFLREAARRYGPGGEFWEAHEQLPYRPIRDWEIWNEQNIVSFATETDPARFAVLVRIAGRALHAVNPGANVILGGLFGRPLQVPPNVASGDFLNRLYRAGGVKPHFDGVALHPYVAEARAMGAQLRNLRRIMRRHGDARTPIYVTELGWGSRSGPTRWERGPWGQAEQLSRAFSLLAANRARWRIAGAWWFTWSDEGGTCLFCGSAGLLTEAREAKPSWYRFTRWTGGDAGIVPRARIGG